MKSVVDHIAILVDDLELAESWYIEHLNAIVTHKDEKYVRLKADNVNIALIDCDIGRK